jgi:L-fuculose-phosphate aldolase
MRLDMMHPADQLVATMNRIYRNGLTTTSGGNLSILDPDGSIWITPGGIDKVSLTRGDIIRIMPDGSVEGCHKPSIELSFHLAAYKSRHDIRAVLHAHSPALAAFSILKQLPDFMIIPNTRIVCGHIAMAPYAMMGSEQLAEIMADQFSRGFSSVIMENHGVTVTAGSMAQAYKIFETLEFSARSELNARKIGPLHHLSEDQIDVARTTAHTRLTEFRPKQRSSVELELRRDMIKFLQRGISQKLFYSSQGTISARVDHNTFLITPFGMDRNDVTEEHLVLVKKGLKEAGKIPSRAVFLHELMYHRNSHIQAIIAAQPSDIMAFAISERKFDPRVMPEPYVLLKNLPRAPYGLNYNNPQQTAAMFQNGISSILLENDGIITTGSTLTQAYDRLEVAEYSARAVLLADSGAAVELLSEDKLQELDANFKF